MKKMGEAACDRRLRHFSFLGGDCLTSRTSRTSRTGKDRLFFYTLQGHESSFFDRENFLSADALEGNQSFQLWSEATQVEHFANPDTPDQDGLVTFEGPSFQRKLELKPFEV